MSRTILFVHGRDFKPSREALLDVSLAALRAGIERDYPDQADALAAATVDMGYYGDLSNELLEGAGKRYDEQLDIGDRQNALAALRAIPARKRFGIRQYDRLPGKSAIDEFVANFAAPLLGAVGLTRWLVSLVSRDACAYLCRDGDYANRVRQRVREKLAEHLDSGRRVLLLSHGMGCVVAYEALWELSHEDQFATRYADAKVDLWLTCGAPLGDHFIRKHLLGAGESPEVRFPTNVITWHNVSAEDDYTCHDNTLADDFRKMLDSHLVSAVRDYRVYNLAVRYGRSNPHSSVGYYIHPRVAKVVADWLRAEPA
jgi:hypothetical protein